MFTTTMILRRRDTCARMGNDLKVMDGSDSANERIQKFAYISAIRPPAI